MNQNADALFKLLIPGIFLLLWALGQLFNKEAAQARTGRRPEGDPLGPRPDRANRPPRRDLDEDPFALANSPRSAPEPPAAQNSGREILYDPRTGRPIGFLKPANPPLEPRNERTATPRSKSRRGSDTGRTKRLAEPSSNLPRTRLATPLDQEQSLTEAALNASTVTSTDRVTLSAESVRSWLTSPVRVREAVLMTQILGPPPGLGRLNRGRRLH